MPDPASLAAFIGAGLLLNITPGPDVLYIVGRSFSQGRIAGVVSALGIAAGSLFHVAAAALGLSTLMATVPAAFDTVRFAGAAYLVWLGVRAVGSNSGALTVQTLAPDSMATIFGQGMVTNMLNPKVAMFFLAFLPQFTDASRGSLTAQFVVLGLVFIINGLVVCLAYALAAGGLRTWLTSRYDVHRWLHRTMGALFIALGVRLAVGGRR